MAAPDPVRYDFGTADQNALNAQRIYDGAEDLGTQVAGQTEPYTKQTVDLLEILVHDVRELRNEIKMLRLGMVAATDSVCVDLEGEFTPVTTSED